MVVDALRDSISEGRWGATLPGEHKLSAEFQIGRPMLRSALKVLEREGYVSISKGKRTRILQRRVQRPRKPRRVSILVSNSFDSLSSWHSLMFLKLQAKLHDAGFQLRINCIGAYRTVDRFRAQLGDLCRRYPSSCWVLVTGFLEIHRYFEARSDEFAALIAGYPAEGCSLPSLSTDRGAACRHAALKLLAQGHRRIALVLPSPPTAAFQRLRNCFLAAFQGVDMPKCWPRVLLHTEERNDLPTRLDRLFSVPAERPTALVVVNPSFTLETLAYCNLRGISIPSELSVIAIGFEPYFNHWYPKITCYRVDSNRYTSHICRLILRLASEGNLPSSRYEFLAELQEGETVAAPVGSR